MTNERDELIRRIAGLTLYDEECGACGKLADEPNEECDEHLPFEPDEQFDAESVLCELIAEARRLTSAK